MPLMNEQIDNLTRSDDDDTERESESRWTGTFLAAISPLDKILIFTLNSFEEGAQLSETILCSSKFIIS